jgi:hypothetical protein
MKIKSICSNCGKQDMAKKNEMYKGCEVFDNKPCKCGGRFEVKELTFVEIISRKEFKKILKRII